MSIFSSVNVQNDIVHSVTLTALPRNKYTSYVLAELESSFVHACKINALYYTIEFYFLCFILIALILREHIWIFSF
jgi:hypothetical protein